MLIIANQRYREVSKQQMMRELQPIMLSVNTLESKIAEIPATFFYVGRETAPRFIIAPDDGGELHRYKRIDLRLVHDREDSS